MGLFRKYINQPRKPEGFLGKLMIKGMNTGHAKLADWGMKHLQTIAPSQVLDIGCGGGRNAGELLKKYPGTKVTAIDYSPLSVEQAAEYHDPKAPYDSYDESDDTREKARTMLLLKQNL